MAPSAQAATPEPTEVDRPASPDHEAVRFPPDEEAALVSESNQCKKEANALFSASDYNAAITTYEAALASCPNYLEFENAVLKSNIAACHLKLEEWKEAIEAATAALDGLERLEKSDAVNDGLVEDVDEEIVSDGAAKSQDNAASQQKADIDRIRSKALMRRARARSETGGWSNLQGAEEDYKQLSLMTNLSVTDRKLVQQQLRVLPARTKIAQEAEVAEMMGKLKQLGNGLLKPFGLSTDNFQFNKDENTGGYSMNFVQGGK